MADDFKILLSTELKSGELDKIKNQINSVHTNPIVLQMDTKNVNNQINSIKQQIQALGNIKIDLGGSSGGNGIGNASTALQRSFRELYNLSKQISNLEIKTGKLNISGVDSGRIATYIGSLNALKSTYQSLMSTLQGNNINFNSVFSQIDAAKTKVAELSSVVDDAKVKLVRDVKLDISSGGLGGQIDAVESKFNKLNIANTEVANGITRLKALLGSMDAADDIESVVTDYQNFQQTLKSVTNQISELQRQQKSALDFANIQAQAAKLASRMDEWVSSGIDVASQFGDQIDEMKRRLESCDAVTLNHVKAEFEQLKASAQQGSSVLTQINKAMTTLGIGLSWAQVFQRGVQYVGKMYDNVVEVDTAMTELYRVTDMTASQYDALYDNMIASAKEYGATFTDIINSTADWSRMGFDANDADQLAGITAMYQHISDLDNGTAMKNLVTAYKGFEEQLLNMYDGDAVAAVEYIADIFNELDNNYAVTADDVGEALTKSASTLEMANNSIAESAAMVTGIIEVSQNPENAGTALKILSLRLRGMKGELEELGEEVDDNVESISKMQTQVLNLTHGSVNIFNDDGTFKSTYEIMQGIAGIWDHISETNQAELLETIAGKERANAVAALINNWDRVEAAMRSASEAEGSAREENEKYMDSIEGRLASLTTSFQNLSNDVINSDAVKAGITGLTEILDLIDEIIKTLGGVGTVAAGFSLFKIFQAADGINGVKNLIGYIQQGTKSFGDFKDMVSIAGSGLKSFMATPAGAATAIGLVVTAISTAITAYNNYKQAQREAWQEAVDAGKAAKEEADEISDLYDIYKSASSAYKGNTGSKESLETATHNLLTALGYEEGAIDELIAKYGDLDAAINTVTLDKLKENLTQFEKAYSAGKNFLLDAASDSWNPFDQDWGMMSWLEDSNEFGLKMGKILEDAGLITSENYNTGGAVALLDTDTIEGAVSAYQKLIDMRQALSEAVENGVITSDELAGSSLYEAIESKIGAIEPYVKDYTEAVENLNNTAANMDYQEYISSNGVPQTQAEFDALRDSMLAAAEANQVYVGTEEQKAAAIDETLKSMPELAQYIEKQNEALEGAAQYTEEQRKQVIDSFKDNSIAEWFHSLSEDDKNLVYRIGIESDDAARWSLEEWKQNLIDMGEAGKTSAQSMQSFYDTITSTKDGNLTDTVQSSLDMVDTLSEAIIKFKSGEMTDAEKRELVNLYPSLNDAMGDIKSFTDEAFRLMDEAEETILNTYNTAIEAAGGEATTLGQQLAIARDRDLAIWGEQWENAASQLAEINARSPFDALFTTFDGEDTAFKQKIDEYVEGVGVLKGAIEDLQKGDLDEFALFDSFPELRKYVGDADALKGAMFDLLGSMNADIIAEFNEQANNLDTEEGRQQLKNLCDSVLEVGQVVGDTQFSISFDAEAEGMENLYAAMKESISATGLASESIENLKERYKGLSFTDAEGNLKDVNDLFERTEHGIHLNVSALRELESAYEGQKKQGFDGQLNDLLLQYDNLTTQINQCADEEERARLIAQQTGLKGQIDEVANLAAQYEGLTSNFYKWEQAQSMGEEGDMYDSLTGSLADIKQLYKEGLIGTNQFRTAVQLMSNEDLSTASIDELLAAYENGYPKMKRYFKDSEDGVLNFLNDVQDLNSEWAHLNEDGSWEIDFGKGNDQEIADALGINVESVQAILRKLSDYGFDINLDSIYSNIELLEDKAKDASGALVEMGKTKIDFRFNTGDINVVESEIQRAQDVLDTFRNTDGTVNTDVEGAEEAQIVLAKLISERQQLNQPVIMNVDTTRASEDVAYAVGLLQQLQNAKNQLEIEIATGSDTTATQQTIQNLAGELSALPEDVKVALGLDDEAFQTTLNEIINSTVSTDVEAIPVVNQEKLDAIQTAISGITPEVLAAVKVDPASIDALTQSEYDTTATVTFDVNDDKVEAFKAEDNDIHPDAVYELEANDVTAFENDNHDITSTATFKKNTQEVDSWIASVNNKRLTAYYQPTLTTTTLPVLRNGKAYYTAYISGTVNANGTAHVNGTAYTKGTVYAQGISGRAYKRGDWGTKESGSALVGELGPEIIVDPHTGKFYTVGDAGAEFAYIPKGAIVFNHEQTESLLKHGHISSRGQSYVQGAALVEGNAYSSGSGKIKVNGKTKTSASKKKSSKKSSSRKDTSSEKEAEEFLEMIDWIEIAIDRIERAISNLDSKVSSTYRSWSSRNSNLKKEIGEIEDEIELQQKAYDRYIKQANSVGLNEKYAAKVRDGTIDIEEIKDEGLHDKIQEYQEWYEKALDCKYAIDELSESLSECYETAFDLIVSQYDAYLAAIEHEKNMLDEYIAQSEEHGYITSAKYYEALMNNQENQIDKLQKKHDQLLASLAAAVNSGAIEEGSEAWYDMASQIDEVTLAIEEGNTAMLEYANSVREIEWSVFDLLQDKISQINDEADFMISLMENDKLYDERGQLTDEGLATMGLHGQNYNILMAQADQYKEEMLKIDKELANDPYNQDLIDRRQELLEAQRESILAAEDEKQAIIDMVQEGIDLELNALDALIEKYEESLNSQKNLYDQQKKLKEQSLEISSLEKQLSAYAGDDSEETKAKVQQLKVDLEEAKNNLEETQYDQYLENTEKLLDELYNEYELILNQRLDNVDALLSEMITSINDNAGIVAAALMDKADSVGYMLTESMGSIWNTSTTGITTVLTAYGDNITNGISSATTTINATLGVMNTNLQSMISQLNSIATTKVQSAATSSVAASTPSQSGNVVTDKNAGTSSGFGSDSNSKPPSGSGSQTDSTNSTKPNNPSNSNDKTNSGKPDAKKDNIFIRKNYSNNVKYNVNTSIVDRLKSQDYDASFKARAKYYEAMGLGKAKNYTGSASQNSKMLSWMKKNNYAKGRYSLPNDELAWTQEGNKLEAIIRPSDGAILTPLARNDSVLNANATSNIWSMANSPEDFIRDNLKIDGLAIPVGQSGGNSYTQNLDKVVFNFPNVKNYDELLSSMQRDKNFERLVLSMTIDQVAGRSALSKGKAVR